MAWFFAGRCCLLFFQLFKARQISASITASHISLYYSFNPILWRFRQKQCVKTISHLRANVFLVLGLILTWGVELVVAVAAGSGWWGHGSFPWRCPGAKSSLQHHLRPARLITDGETRRESLTGNRVIKRRSVAINACWGIPFKSASQQVPSAHQDYSSLCL